MNPTAKTLGFWVVITVSAFVSWQVVRSSPKQQTVPEISYSEFLSRVEAGNVANVTVSGNDALGKYRDGRSFRVVVPTSQDGMLQTLRQKGVEIWFRNATGGGQLSWLLNLAPLVLLAALWFFMIRQIKARQAKTTGEALQSAPKR